MIIPDLNLLLRPTASPVPPYVRIEPGNYTVDRPLVPASWQHVDARGCTFTVTHIGIGIDLHARGARWQGGRFVFPSASLGPMVRMADATEQTIEGVTLRGGSQRLATGIQIGNIPPAELSPVYLSRVVDCSISDCAVGVLLATNANLVQVRGVVVQRVASGGTAFLFDGAIESRVECGIVHGGGGPDVTVIGMRNRSFYNYASVTAEPGGQAIPYRIEADCFENQIECQLNCAGAAVNLGRDNFIRRRGNKS